MNIYEIQDGGLLPFKKSLMANSCSSPLPDFGEILCEGTVFHRISVIRQRRSIKRIVFLMQFGLRDAFRIVSDTLVLEGVEVVVVVVEMNIIKVALSHFCCRTTVQSDSVSVTRQVTVRRWQTARDILLVSRKGRLEQHSLQFPSEDRKRRRVLDLL